MLLGDQVKGGVVKDAAASERRPGLGHDAVRGMERPGFALRQPRVQLDLVDGRHDSGLGEQPVEVVGVEVADPDRADPPFGLEPFEGAPGVNVPVLRRCRPVDEVKVEQVEAEQVHAVLERAKGAVETVIGVPDFGRHEQVVAVDP